MSDLPFTAFWAGRASPEYKETVVKQALEHIKTSGKADRKLASSIDETIKISGFRNSSTAPIPRLAKPVVRKLDFSNDLAAAVFEAWAKSQRRLHDAVAERLAISGIPVVYPDFAGGGFRGTWSAEDWRRERDAVIERHGEFGSDDALLMLCYATGLMPSDTEKPRLAPNGETGSDGPGALDFDAISQWKRTLLSLSSDSPIWDEEIPSFIEWLSSLAAEKTAERGIAVRWREVISEMSEPGPIFNQLNSVGVSAVSWAAAEFASPSTAAKALATAEDLKTVVENLVEHLAGSSNLGRVIESYERIKTLRADLDAILASPIPPDGEPPKPKGEDAAAESGGAPMAISDAVATSSQDAGDAVGLEENGGASVIDGEDAFSTNDGGAPETELGVEESDAIDAPAPPIESPLADAVDDANEDGETESLDEIGGAPDAVEEHAESPGELEAAMWEMAGEGDLSGAYWVARSLEARGREPSAPSHLFAAAQGARWLSPNSDGYVEDLVKIAGYDIPESEVEKLLGLAAALQASVIKPETNLAAWLVSPESCPRLDRVTAPIREFKDFGRPAMPGDIRGQDGILGLRKAIDEASEDAGEWLDASLTLTHSYPPATAVLRSLCKDGGEVREMLTPVANGNQAKRESVKAIAENLTQERYAVDAINRVHQSIAAGGSSSRLSPIVSHARNWLVGKIQEAASKATRWRNLVERELESASGGNEWWMNQVSSLRDGMDANAGEAFAELNELRSDARDAAASAAAGCVAAALARLLAHLQLPIPESADSPAAPTVAEDLDAIAADRADRLETAMGRRLIWTPAARLDDDCLPASDSLVKIGASLLENRRAPISLCAALNRRAEDHQDYRFYDVMSVRLSENRRAELEAARGKSRKASEDALADHAASARHDLQQAVRDGILEFDVLEWESSNDIIGRFISDDGDCLNRDAIVDDFQSAHEEIETIQDLLGEKRDEKRAELKSEWSGLLDSARERADIDECAMRTWEAKFAQADSHSEIRVMEVCAARLGNYLNSGERLLPADRYDSAPHSAFGEFDGFLRGTPDPKERARGSSGLKALVNS